MSQITTILDKVQRSREGRKDHKTKGSFHISGIQSFDFNTIVMIFIASSIIAVVFISVIIIALDIGSEKTVQNNINNLKRTVSIQQQSIVELTDALNKTKSSLDDQLQMIRSNLEHETEDRKFQVNNLALIDNKYYVGLMKSIIVNSQQINYLNRNIDTLRLK